MAANEFDEEVTEYKAKKTDTKITTLDKQEIIINELIALRTEIAEIKAMLANISDNPVSLPKPKKDGKIGKVIGFLAGEDTDEKR